MHYRLDCLIGFLILQYMVSAQILPVDSPEEILEQRQKVFTDINLENPYEDSLWYRGRIYEFDIGSHIGTPYFLDIGILAGKLTFKGKLHENLRLSYNLVTDELIIEEYDSENNMTLLVLNKYFVEDFTLTHYGQNYLFRMNTEMKPIHDKLEEGFCEVIYDDELQMFVRHKKVLFFDASKYDHYSYKDENRVYLIVAGKLYRVNSRRDYLRAFQVDRKSLRRYMRQANINFEKSGTKSLSALCAYSKSLLDNQTTGIEENN